MSGPISRKHALSPIIEEVPKARAVNFKNSPLRIRPRTVLIPQTLPPPRVLFRPIQARPINEVYSYYFTKETPQACWIYDVVQCIEKKLQQSQKGFVDSVRERVETILYSKEEEETKIGELATLLYYIERDDFINLAPRSFLHARAVEILERIVQGEEEHAKLCGAKSSQIPATVFCECLRTLARQVVTPKGHFIKAGAIAVKKILPQLAQKIGPMHASHIDRCCDAIANHFGFTSLFKRIESNFFVIEESMKDFIRLEWHLPKDHPVTPDIIQWSLIKALFSPIYQESFVPNCFAVAPASCIDPYKIAYFLFQSLREGTFDIQNKKMPIFPIVSKNLFDARSLFATLSSTQVKQLRAVHHIEQALAVTPRPSRTKIIDLEEAFAALSLDEETKEYARWMLGSFVRSPLQQVLIKYNELQNYNHPTWRGGILNDILHLLCPSTLPQKFRERVREQMEQTFFVESHSERLFESMGSDFFVGGKEKLKITIPPPYEDAFKSLFENALYLVSMRQGYRRIRSIKELCQEVSFLVPYNYEFSKHLREKAPRMLAEYAAKLHLVDIPPNIWESLDLFFLCQIGGHSMHVFKQMGLRPKRESLKANSSYNMVLQIQEKLYNHKRTVVENRPHAFVLDSEMSSLLTLPPPVFRREVEECILKPGRRGREKINPSPIELRQIFHHAEIEVSEQALGYLANQPPTEPYILACKLHQQLTEWKVFAEKMKLYEAICKQLELPQFLILGTKNYSNEHADFKEPTFFATGYDASTGSLAFFSILGTEINKLNADDFLELDVLIP